MTTSTMPKKNTIEEAILAALRESRGPIGTNDLIAKIYPPSHLSRTPTARASVRNIITKLRRRGWPISDARAGHKAAAYRLIAGEYPALHTGGNSDAA